MESTIYLLPSHIIRLSVFGFCVSSFVHTFSVEFILILERSSIYWFSPIYYYEQLIRCATIIVHSTRVQLEMNSFHSPAD